MKYDEMDKLEVNAYPNENVVKESGKVREKKKFNSTKTINAALFVSAVGAGTATAMLLSTVVTMAMNGQLASVFQALLP